MAAMKHIVMMVALSIFFFLAGTACGLALPLDVHDLSFAEGIRGNSSRTPTNHQGLPPYELRCSDHDLVMDSIQACANHFFDVRDAEFHAEPSIRMCGAIIGDLSRGYTKVTGIYGGEDDGQHAMAYGWEIGNAMTSLITMCGTRGGATAAFQNDNTAFIVHIAPEWM